MRVIAEGVEYARLLKALSTSGTNANDGRGQVQPLHPRVTIDWVTDEKTTLRKRPRREQILLIREPSKAHGHSWSASIKSAASAWEALSSGRTTHPLRSGGLAIVRR